MRLLFLVPIVLTGCANMTPQEKTAVWVGFAVTAIVLSKDSERYEPEKVCKSGPRLEDPECPLIHH